jgi:hypothetical protein
MDQHVNYGRIVTAEGPAVAFGGMVFEVMRAETAA